MNTQFIKFEVVSEVAQIALNRPNNFNALTPEMIAEMIAALDYIVAQTGVRALLITGAGKGFCAGADLNAAEGAGGGQNTVLETHYNRLLFRLVELPYPIVTAVNGAAVGAGCAIALLSDFIVASDDAYFLQAFVNIGLVPDMGATWILPRLLGVARATEVLMLGEKISAQKAEAWGMLYKVVGSDDLLSEAQNLAGRLAAGPTLAYGLIRQGLRFGLERSLAETVNFERRSQLQAAQSEDFKEGVAAFRERRAARFNGR